MVYNFISTAVDPPAVIYVGKDKFESPCASLIYALIYHHRCMPKGWYSSFVSFLLKSKGGFYLS